MVIVPRVWTETLVVHIHPEHGVGGQGGQEGGGGHHGLPGDVRLGDVPVAVQDPDQERGSEATAELERLRDLGMDQVQAPEELLYILILLPLLWLIN